MRRLLQFELNADLGGHVDLAIVEHEGLVAPPLQGGNRRARQHRVALLDRDLGIDGRHSDRTWLNGRRRQEVAQRSRILFPTTEIPQPAKWRHFCILTYDW